VAALTALPPAFARRPHPVTAYVRHGDAVTPIQTVTGRPSQAIKAGCSPMTMAITPNGKTLYVSNCATCGSGLSAGIR
jgi:DNA-binding beta-propeller fold protein YncE